MNDTNVMGEVETPKVAAFANRKYSNEERRKHEQEELDELIAQQNGETKESAVQEDDQEPVNAEDKSFKKRYGDLRRHVQEKEKTWEDKFAKLEKLIIPLLIKLAKSPEAYIHWPNRAQVIEAQVKKIIEITRGK